MLRLDAHAAPSDLQLPRALGLYGFRSCPHTVRRGRTQGSELYVASTCTNAHRGFCLLRPVPAGAPAVFGASTSSEKVRHRIGPPGRYPLAKRKLECDLDHDRPRAAAVRLEIKSTRAS